MLTMKSTKQTIEGYIQTAIDKRVKAGMTVREALGEVVALANEAAEEALLNNAPNAEHAEAYMADKLKVRDSE